MTHEVSTKSAESEGNNCFLTDIPKEHDTGNTVQSLYSQVPTIPTIHTPSPKLVPP